MMGKQSLVDALIVLVIPVLLIAGYYLWWRPADTTQLLSSTAPSAVSAENEPGAKTKLALKTLQSITLDGSLFTDPAFLSLRTYTVTVPSVPVARPYPFTLPSVVLERLKLGAQGKTVSSSSSGSSSSSASSSAASAKITALKASK